MTILIFSPFLILFFIFPDQSFFNPGAFSSDEALG